MFEEVIPDITKQVTSLKPFLMRKNGPSILFCYDVLKKLNSVGELEKLHV